MTALVSSELLKVRTVRSWWVYLGVVVLISAISVAASIGAGDPAARGTVEFQRGLADAIVIATLIGLILGITVVTSEFRHGTVTPTFLVTPVRERVLAAKAATVAIVALALALLSLAVAAAITIVWLTAIGADLHLASGELWQAVGRQLLVTLLWALVGVAVGSAVHGQVAALVGTLVWVFLVESLLAGLFAVLGVEGLVGYLPFRALDAADGGAGEGLLSYEGGLLVSAAWIAALGALGVARTRRRDIS